MSQQQTVVRAATFPFFPHGGAETWKELDPLLNRAWRMSTELANWAMSQLYNADSLTVNRQSEKLESMPYIDLHGLGFTQRNYPRREDWNGATTCANSILQAVKKVYVKKRLDIIWRRACSLPTFRFPYPYPVHQQSWEPFYGKDNVPLVSLNLPGQRVVLRLRGGIEMRRQLDRFRQLANGCKRGELSLYRKGKHSMVKLVGHFPVTTARHADDRLMFVRTDPVALWVAEIAGMDARVWNQDHIRAKVEGHRIWLQRISEDMKHEKRVPEQMRRHMQGEIEKRCAKQNNRLDSFCHEMSSQLVGFAERQRVSKIIYVDDDTSWLDRFPWFRLKEKVKYKCRDRGIEFVSGEEGIDENASVEVVNETLATARGV